MYRILIVDDDPLTREETKRLLSLAGHEVETAKNGRTGLSTALLCAPHVALINLVLPDMSGIDVLRQLHRIHPKVGCVLITSFGEQRSAVDAIRVGVCDYAERPLASTELLDVIERAASHPAVPRVTGSELRRAEAHALTRWASVVVRAIESPTDTRTLQEWGRFVGTSTGTLRNWCRTARLSARRSLLFSRVLRAVVRQEAQGTLMAPEHLLNIVDRRTLAKLLAASGGTPERLPSSVPSFLKGQQLIENQDAVAEVRTALTARVTRQVRSGLSATHSVPADTRTMFVRPRRARFR